jgi:hypothetical protein
MDGYVVLSLAIVLLIFHMNEFGEHRHLSQYFLPQKEMRLSQGVTLILFHLMNGLLLFIPFAFTYLYDYTGGAAVALTGAIVLISVSGRIEQISRWIADKESLQALLRRYFTDKGLVSIAVLQVLACSEGLVINALLASYLLQDLFHIPPMLTGVLLMAFAFIYAGMGGIGGIRKVGFWLFALMLAALTLIPVAVYLLKGITITHLQLEEMNLLKMKTGSLAIGCAAFACMFMGRLMLNVLAYPEYTLIKKKRIRIAYQLTTVCWCALPLSVSVIMLYFLSFPSTSSLFQGSLPTLLEAIPGNLSWLILHLFLFFILSAFVLGVGTSLHGILGTLQSTFPSLSKVKHIYALAMLLCCVPLLIIPFGEQAMRAVIGFYIYLLMASGLPIYLMWNSKKHWGVEFAGGVLLSTIMGGVISRYTGWLIGSICCVILSYIIYRMFVLIKTQNI